MGSERLPYAIDDGERLLLFDPLGVPSELVERAAGRRAAVVLTAPWHERDAQSLVERLGTPVYTPLPDTAEYLMESYGITAGQAGNGSPDVVWLLREGIGEAHPYSAGDRLDVGVEAFPGQKPNDMVLWIESHRAVVAGLRPLLELPLEHVLATHGGPTGRAALGAALS